MQQAKILYHEQCKLIDVSTQAAFYHPQLFFLTIFIPLKKTACKTVFFFWKGGEGGVCLRYIIDQRLQKKFGAEKDEKKKVRYNFLCINVCMTF